MSPRTDTCRNGHEREGNTYTRPGGGVKCRECNRIAMKERRAGVVREPQFARDLRGDHDGPHSYWTPAYGTHETPTIAEVLSAWED